MSDHEDSEPTFKKPDAAKPNADPYAEQRAYFAYWEAKRIIDEQNRRNEWDSLSIYEKARRK